jgi:hypothetical protein
MTLKNRVFLGDDKVAPVEIQEAFLVRADAGEVLGIVEEGSDPRRIVEPEFGDAVVLDGRQARHFHGQRVLLDVATHVVAYGRQGGEQCRVNSFVVFHELGVRHGWVAFQEDGELGH